MGTLRCDYNPSKKNLNGTFRNKDYDDWEYTLSGDTLEGTLTMDLPPDPREKAAIPLEFGRDALCSPV